MLDFTYPWMYLLLPFPIVVYVVFPVYKQNKDSVQVPFFSRLVELSGETPSAGAVILERLFFQRVWVVICWVLVVSSLAKPIWVGDLVTHDQSARDLMIAVDLSGSMETVDFADNNGDKVSRLVAVKAVLREFVHKREGDRLGLIFFGSAAYLQAPFTDDHATWATLLEEAEVGMAGVSTVFGDAIGLAINLFNRSETNDKVLIVLTDGNDTGSRVPPIDAAKVAASKNLTIYTIAIGDPETAGEEAMDIEVLEKVTALTGGVSYQALNRQELDEIYQRIAQLEPELYESLSYRPTTSLHYYPIIFIACVYCLLYLLLGRVLLRSLAVNKDV